MPTLLGWRLTSLGVEKRSQRTSVNCGFLAAQQRPPCKRDMLIKHGIFDFHPNDKLHQLASIVGTIIDYSL